MKKLLIALLIVLVVALIAVAVLLSRLGGIVKTAIETYGPRYTETTVTVDKIDFSLLGGSASVENFAVGNPKGFSDNPLLGFKLVQLGIEPKSLLTDVVDIREIVIKNPEFLYEIDGVDIRKSNLQVLLDNVQKNTGGDQAQPKEEKTTEAQSEEQSEPKKLIIRHFLLEGVKVNLRVAGLAQTVTIPTIELVDLGVAENGTTPAKISAAITAELLTQILPHIQQVVTDMLSGKLTEAAGAVVNQAQDAAKEVQEKLGDTLGKGKEGVDKVLDNVKIPGF
jgi:DNA-binding TFAR19-related protein (PDSD5 family)